MTFWYFKADAHISLFRANLSHSGGVDIHTNFRYNRILSSSWLYSYWL